MGPFETIADVRRANDKAGHHWFEADTIRFFGSKIESVVYGGRYFVSSEQPPFGARAFTVRRCNDDGSISTVGEFCSIRTRAIAQAMCRDYAENGEPSNA